MDNKPQQVFGEDCEFCPVTGRAFERGSGALSREQQTAQFIRERELMGARPREGERCAQTGREYECGSGSLSKERQTAAFLREANPMEAKREDARTAAVVTAEEVKRLATSEEAALTAMAPVGATIN